MAEPQDISRAAAFLVEGLIFLNRISDQCSACKGLIHSSPTASPPFCVCLCYAGSHHGPCGCPVFTGVRSSAHARTHGHTGAGRPPWSARAPPHCHDHPPQLRCRKLAHASRLPPCMTILQSAFGLCMSCIAPITHQSNARREREPLLHGEVRTGPVWIHCLGPMANSCQLDRERAGCQGWQALACWPDKTKPPTSCTKRCPFGSFQAPRLESLVQPTSIVRDRNRTLFRANSLSIRLW